METKIYLDYNATTPLDPQVLDAICSSLRDDWGNPSSSHNTGMRAKQTISQARKNIAEMIGAKAEDIIFTSGGTEANNLVIHSIMKYHKSILTDEVAQYLPHFITSNLEHDSVRLPLEFLQKEGLADVTFVAASKDTGFVRADDVVAALKPSTRLVSIMMANNETGVVQPIRDIVDKVKAASAGFPWRIVFHTDAAQCIGKIDVNVDNLGVDYLTIVGHKFYAPRIGALYVRDPFQRTPIHAMFFGGGQERSFRPGTENTGMIAGLGKAAELVSTNLQAYSSSMKRVRDYLEDKLKAEFGDKVLINCCKEGVERLPNTSSVAFVGPDYDGEKVLDASQRVEASLGAACHSVVNVNRPIGLVGVHDASQRQEASVGGAASNSVAKVIRPILIAQVLKAIQRQKASVGGAASNSVGKGLNHTLGSVKRIASSVLLNSGVPEEVARNTIRLSVGRETTEQDIDIAIEDLKYAVKAATL